MAIIPRGRGVPPESPGVQQKARVGKVTEGFGSACFTAYFGLQVTRELLKHFNRNIISEKGPSALGVTQRALARPLRPDTASVTSR